MMRRVGGGYHASVIPLPDAQNGRWVWSAGVLCIVAVFVFGLWTMVAPLTFPTKYTFGEVLSAVGATPLRPVWDEAVRTRYVAFGPAALLLWLPCMIRWRDWRVRVAVASLALLIPLAVCPPLGMRAVPFALLVPCMWPALFGGTGETYSDGTVCFLATGLWVWSLGTIALLHFRRREQARDVCGVCGYSTVGLPNGVCPECGTAFPTRSDAPGKEGKGSA